MAMRRLAFVSSFVAASAAAGVGMPGMAAAVVPLDAVLGPPDRGCAGGDRAILIDGRITRVLALGDLQYDSGTLSAFQASFDPLWGRLKAITRPAVGNHEYDTAGAAGYFDYFNGVGSCHAAPAR